MTLEFEGLGFKDKIPTGITGEIQLLSITIPPTGSFDAGNKYYNSTDKLIYTAVTDNTWDGAIASIPLSNIFYTFDNEGTIEYYQWDGENLVEVSVGAFQLKANMSQDYTDDDPTKYPSSKALSEGLKHTSSFELFDIKTNSEPMTQKGWCCISDTQPKRLAKASVPTAYNFLKDKLDNKNTQITNWQKNTTGGYIPVFYYNGYWYLRQTFGKNIYRTQYLDFIDVELLQSNVFVNGSRTHSKVKIAKLNNQTVFVAISCPANYTTTYTLRIYDTNWSLIREKTIAGFESATALQDFCVAEDIEKVFILPYIWNGSGNIPYRLFVYDYNNDTFDTPQITLDIVSGKYMYGSTILYFENYIYIATTTKYCKINPNDYTYESKNISEDGNPQANASDNYKISSPTNCKLFINNNKLTIFCYYNTSSERITRAWEMRSNGTWRNLVNKNPAYVDGKLYALDCKNGIIYYCLRQQYNGSDTAIIYSTNFIDDDEIIYNYETTPQDATIIINENNEICTNIIVTDNQSVFVYSSTVPIVYTDTINGIDIKYYKNGNYKICTPTIDVGNDDNLQDVFEYLGYLNYWWIDETNEQITLQRNSNMWTMMYVGDDYEDDSLPSGNYYAYATKNDIPDVSIYKEKTETIEIDTASVTIDNVLANKNYVFTNNAITDITLTACETSMEETTIQFTTGSSAPTLTDNSGLVWFGGIPTLQTNTTYVIVIFNKQAFYQEN